MVKTLYASHRKVDVVIIGAGYWGCAIADFARDKGKSVLVIDDGDPVSGSRNASAIVDPRAYASKTFRRYWPVEWRKEELRDSLDWLISRGGLVTQEWFINQFAKTAARKQTSKMIYLRDSYQLLRLAGGVCNSRVTFIVENGSGITLGVGGNQLVEAQSLVVAAGYRTDQVLALIGIKKLGITHLYGRGIEARGKPKSSHPLPISVMVLPYVKHTVREWAGGVYKIGDTAEDQPDDSKLQRLREVGRITLDDYQETKINAGYRPVLDRFTVEKITSRIIVATGGHRLGLGIAGLVGKRVMEMV